VASDPESSLTRPSPTGSRSSICEADRAVQIHPTIEFLGQEVRVLVEQTTAVDPQRLGEFAGRLSHGELMEVNVALRAVLDLE
jgi:mRNA-degrading endonuclease toxin of MazEF toxin-antitoxin module